MAAHQRILLETGSYAIGAGKLDKQIADELDTSERTVKTRRAQLMTKLGADSAAALGRLDEKRRQASG